MVLKITIKVHSLILSVMLVITMLTAANAETGVHNTNNTKAYSPDAYVTRNVQDYEGAPGTSAIDFYPKYPKIQYKPGMNKKLIEKGEYLVKAGDCMACHTDTPNHGKPFAGGLALDTPFGKFFSPNITESYPVLGYPSLPIPVKVST